MFVSGNLPFYERYTIQCTPFVGIAMLYKAELSAKGEHYAIFASGILFAVNTYQLWKYV